MKPLNSAELAPATQVSHKVDSGKVPTIAGVLHHSNYRSRSFPRLVKTRKETKRLLLFLWTPLASLFMNCFSNWTSSNFWPQMIKNKLNRAGFMVPIVTKGGSKQPTVSWKLSESIPRSSKAGRHFWDSRKWIFKRFKSARFSICWITSRCIISRLASLRNAAKFYI